MIYKCFLFSFTSELIFHAAYKRQLDDGVELQADKLDFVNTLFTCGNQTDGSGPVWYLVDSYMSH